MADVRLQLVGMPQAAHHRIAPKFDLWVHTLPSTYGVRLVPSRHDVIPLIEEPEFVEIAKNIQAGYVHIAVVPSKFWKRVEQRFRFDCRVVELRAASSDPKVWTWQTFADLIRDRLNFEAEWSDGIKPRDTNSPLLLPPRSFEPVPALKDFWNTCDCYDRERLAQAVANLANFTQAHRHSQQGVFWLDLRDRAFRPATGGARHALTPAERQDLQSFRFCFAVPRGFHYDVQHDSGRTFSMSGSNGDVANVIHVNVDPWGRLRS